MSNLSQEKKTAKADHLNAQLEKTIEIYKAASVTERKAAIRHIDSFLESLPGDDQKTFWLKLRQKLERMNESFAMDVDSFNTIYLGGNSVFPQ